jgi:outer membrane lipoprotein-sorting protein
MRSILAASLAFAAIAPPSVAAAAASAAELERVLRDFDRVQESIRTLRASFTETTRSTLLKEAIVAKGTVCLTKPDAVRWEYSVPEEMRFIIANDEYTGYFPQRKQAERRDIHRWREQLFRVLGLGQVSAELATFYDIRLEDPAAGDGATYLLVLDPRKKRVRKRMEAVRFWIDASSYLPRRVEYSGKNGSTRLIEFDRFEVNPELSAALYSMELPPDVEVTQGFSALSGLSSAPSD